MKVSEAMRLGAMAVPPTRPKLHVFNRDDDGNICGACAIGSVMLSVGLLDEFAYSQAATGKGPLLERFPILAAFIEGPIITPPEFMFYQVISVLYEVAGWSRERIADWVATIEAQHEQPSVQPDSVPIPVGERVSK